MSVRPPFFTRLLFWLILGLFSTFFAEVVSASSPFVFFTAFGLIGTYPIYLLHTLVLGTLVIRRGKVVSLQALYFAGGIFGLYEAYITKVLWSPPWNSTPLRWRAFRCWTLLSWWASGMYSCHSSCRCSPPKRSCCVPTA
ncbi:MAG: hypothetical protein ABSA51_04985 [Anaerolineaceae bacterium]